MNAEDTLVLAILDARELIRVVGVVPPGFGTTHLVGHALVEVPGERETRIVGPGRIVEVGRDG